jgi:hypothetical protein
MAIAVPPGRRVRNAGTPGTVYLSCGLSLLTTERDDGARTTWSTTTRAHAAMRRSRAMCCPVPLPRPPDVPPAIPHDADHQESAGNGRRTRCAPVGRNHDGLAVGGTAGCTCSSRRWRPCACCARPARKRPRREHPSRCPAEPGALVARPTPRRSAHAQGTHTPSRCWFTIVRTFFRPRCRVGPMLPIGMSSSLAMDA